MTPIFSPAVIYRASDGSSTIQFHYNDRPDSFAWQGASLDKVGTYQLSPSGDRWRLELSYNFAREQTLRLTVLQMTGERIARFRLTDSQGRETEFKAID